MKTTETHISFEHKSNRVLANRVLKAMSQLCGYSNGTIRNPYELASITMDDGRTLIESIYEDGEADYHDDFYVVEVHPFYENKSCIYVALTGKAEQEYDEIEYIDNISEYQN